MTTATTLTKYQPIQGLIATNVTELETLGNICAASGFFQDARQAAQAMVKIAAGQELGLAPIQSMTGIHVINNRVTLSANLMAALLKKAGYKWRIVRFDDQECSLIMIDPSGAEIGPSSFSINDANKAGLKGGNWAKYPRNMLFARAISNAARWYAPEVITGCYTPEEMGAGIADTEVSCIEPVHEAASTYGVEQDIPADYTEVEATAAKADYDRAMKHIHAVGKDFGLLHEEIRAITGAKSLTELSAVDLDSWALAIAELTQHDVDDCKAMMKAHTLQELRTAWDSLSQKGRAILANVKDAAKARISTYITEAPQQEAVTVATAHPSLDQGKCKGCGADIYWGKTNNYTSVPLNPPELWAVEGEGKPEKRYVAIDSGKVVMQSVWPLREGVATVSGHLGHHASCPDAAKYRRSSKSENEATP